MVFEQIRSTFRGYHIWKRLIRRGDIHPEEGLVILLPAGDSRVNCHILQLLNEVYMRKMYTGPQKTEGDGTSPESDRCFELLTDDEDVMRFGVRLCPHIRKILSVKKRDLEDLISAYAAYPFSYHLIIGKLGTLHGRGGKDALASLGITLDEIILDGLFDLRINYPNDELKKTMFYTDAEKDLAAYVEKYGV